MQSKFIRSILVREEPPPMAQQFLSLPNGNPGTPVVVPVSEGRKTFYAGGIFECEAIVLEVSADGVKFNTAASVFLPNAGPQEIDVTASFARVRVKGLRSGVPVCLLAVNTIAGVDTQVVIPVPGASGGVGAVVPIDTLPRQKTIYVVASGASVAAKAVVVEVSMDDVNFNALFKIQGSLYVSGGAILVEGFFKSARARTVEGPGTGMTIVAAADPTCC